MMQVMKQTWEKAKQVKRCFNENMIRKTNTMLLYVMISDNF